MASPTPTRQRHWLYDPQKRPWPRGGEVRGMRPHRRRSFRRPQSPQVFVLRRPRDHPEGCGHPTALLHGISPLGPSICGSRRQRPSAHRNSDCDFVVPCIISMRIDRDVESLREHGRKVTPYIADSSAHPLRSSPGFCWWRLRVPSDS